MFVFSKRSIKNMEGVNHKLIEIAKKALSISKIDFGIPNDGGLRTAQEQFKLYSRNLTKCDGTYKKSCHQLGNALDVYAYVNGKASWENEYLSQIANAMLQSSIILGYKITWGGLWKNFIDMPHFELINE